MKKMYAVIGNQLLGIGEDELRVLQPLLEDAILELIDSIKKSKNFESAEEDINLLYLATFPLASLCFNHGVKLQKINNDIFRFENISDNNVKQGLYFAVKEGRMLSTAATN